MKSATSSVAERMVFAMESATLVLVCDSSHCDGKHNYVFVERKRDSESERERERERETERDRERERERARSESDDAFLGCEGDCARSLSLSEETKYVLVLFGLEQFENSWSLVHSGSCCRCR